MTMKAAELVPYLSTPAKIEKARKAYDALLKAAGRKFTPASKVQTTFPKTPGEGGLFNNKNAIANWMLAWFLYQDENALRSAVWCCDWLRNTWGQRDRAHGHRYAWWPIVGRAAYEADIDHAERFDEDFLGWFRYCAGDPYVKGVWTGSTLRPFIRIHGAAIQTATVMEKLIDAGEMHKTDPVPSALRARAIKSLVGWANVHQDGTKRWGFLHDKPRPAWNEFPYQDTKTWTASVTHLTWIMPGVIVPDEAASIRLHVSPAEWRILSDFKARAKQIATHAIRWGFRQDTGGNMKAIGDGKPGSYCPPGETGGPLVPPMERAESMFEPGYYGGIPLALLAAARNKDERRKLIIDWTKTCRAVSEGEVTPGLVLAALKVAE